MAASAVRIQALVERASRSVSPGVALTGMGRSGI